ncbi:hypothetical protein PQY70_00750 [Flavobacteriaceae bacterium]|nr:hypothetical protein [Flavobacteriaceae bacterium]
MYSIDFDNTIIKSLELVDTNHLFPHEKTIKKNSSTLTNFLKSFENYIIISSILCCSKSMVIIDGHHRYFTLKKLGFKKIPVTKIDYFSEGIITNKTEQYSKQEIIENAISGKLMKPKSTSHKIYCNKSKKWQPIMLLSSLFKIDVKSSQENL